MQGNSGQPASRGAFTDGDPSIRASVDLKALNKGSPVWIRVQKEEWCSGVLQSCRAETCSVRLDMDAAFDGYPSVSFMHSGREYFLVYELMCV